MKRRIPNATISEYPQHMNLVTLCLCITDAGPKEISKVGLAINALEVMYSPSLGGPVKVSISDCKKWSPQIYEVPLNDFPDESADIVAEPEPLAEPMTVDE